ncbi:riboflavin synthase [Actinomyces oris]|uniref:Riboflavin synthase n=1 Tax=Actinomyces oris TaxID=544580 RepID=A0A1Q8VAP3_9ACTO|nr:riboflavin synthase [Actinomyces oris]OLO45151.1 riboflavin synthase subunit alpha [Actinomyces oris]
MFTGIVEELGQVVALEHSAALEARSARLSVRGPVVVEGTRTGDSISVNGCCLTVSELSDGVFVADVMAETLQRTGLGTLAPGSRVNLERALRPGDRMGGHTVQGHVDTTGTLLARHHEERWDVLEISVPDELMGYVAVKGSIAIDGISLTVVDVVDGAGSEGTGGRVTVSLIPETLRRTTLGLTQVGEAVNLEVDVMAKYIARYLSRYVPDNVPQSAG